MILQGRYAAASESLLYLLHRFFETPLAVGALENHYAHVVLSIKRRFCFRSFALAVGDTARIQGSVRLSSGEQPLDGGLRQRPWRDRYALAPHQRLEALQLPLRLLRHVVRVLPLLQFAQRGRIEVPPSSPPQLLQHPGSLPRQTFRLQSLFPQSVLDLVRRVIQCGPVARGGTLPLVNGGLCSCVSVQEQVRRRALAYEEAGDVEGLGSGAALARPSCQPRVGVWDAPDIQGFQPR